MLYYLMVFSCLTACASQTVVTEEVLFKGEGQFWNATYIYNPDLENGKGVNWIEIDYIEDESSNLDVNKIDIELESRDGLITGNIGQMENRIEGNTISFLVGTVNEETYIEDEYKLIIKFNDEQDVIKLKHK